MIKYCARFSLEPVGQGLFYTGKIGSFNMVYDCGSMKALNKISSIIGDYKSRLGNSKIDMLIISHLHLDHVSGIEELMKNTKVRYVFLPYLLPIQRLLLALGGHAHLTESYLNLLIDPVSYFLELGADKVVLISGNNSKNDERYERNNDEFPGGEFDLSSEDLNDEAIKLSDNEDLRKMIRDYDNQLFEENFEGKILLKNHTGLVTLRKKWVFRFFSPPTKQNLSQLEKCVKQILPNTGNINNVMLKKILLNKGHLDKLEKCYKNTFKELNDTSLIVFHGPTKKQIHSLLCPADSTRNMPSNYYFYHCKTELESNVKFGWVLTGDVNFKKVSSAFLKHFSDCLDQMNNLLIPHHGSKGNWNLDIMKHVVSPGHWFVSFGLGNNHHHPNADVISDIVTSGNSVSLCNDINRIDQYVFP
ncbi:MBL fold metallo-hydrolase [Cuniculiplasma divulgatum]|jgi:hypothetical protein|uniref:Metal-dependent hydrolase of the beta-lactamase superfamily II n=1 Tax=Cuniculiplasma divulgatum TaxID=1673428 RepID=A0A1N5S5H2_9ARCH|nr:MBL fold metallo-hydrolase [Cuniculiplasma divulgatum]SIM31170.1 metal-dependent hydrolase of the beta-lactamase superfamily II [Cuniculiplasma divulgatum]